MAKIRFRIKGFSVRQLGQSTHFEHCTSILQHLLLSWMTLIKPFLGFRGCCVVADLCIWPLFARVWLSVVTEVRGGKTPIHLVIQYGEFSAPDVRTKPPSPFSTTCSVLLCSLCVHRFSSESCVPSSPRQREPRRRPLLLQTAATSTPYWDA